MDRRAGFSRETLQWAIQRILWKAEIHRVKETRLWLAGNCVGGTDTSRPRNGSVCEGKRSQRWSCLCPLLQWHNRSSERRHDYEFELCSDETPKHVNLYNSSSVTLFTKGFQISELTKFLPRDNDDSTIMFMPLYHAAGLNGLFECVARGLRFLLMANFTLERLLRTVQDYKV